MPDFLRKRRKLVPAKTLEQYHARLLRVHKDQVLFHEGEVLGNLP